MPSFLRDAVLKAVLLRSELALSLPKGEASVSPVLSEAEGKDTALGNFSLALQTGRPI